MGNSFTGEPGAMKYDTEIASGTGKPLRGGRCQTCQVSGTITWAVQHADAEPEHLVMYRGRRIQPKRQLVKA
jgi:hypothetical protein